MIEKEYIFVGNAQLKTRDYIKQLEKDNREKDKEIERLTCDNESLSSNNSKLAKIILNAIRFLETAKELEYKTVIEILKGSDKDE